MNENLSSCICCRIAKLLTLIAIVYVQIYWVKSLGNRRLECIHRVRDFVDRAHCRQKSIKIGDVAVE